MQPWQAPDVQRPTGVPVPSSKVCFVFLDGNIEDRHKSVQVYGMHE